MDILRVVETAELELVLVILTKIVRVERFHDGAWDNAIRSGLFLTILQRLKKLLANDSRDVCIDKFYTN